MTSANRLLIPHHLFAMVILLSGSQTAQGSETELTIHLASERFPLTVIALPIGQCPQLISCPDGWDSMVKSQPLAVINAGYVDTAHQPTGLRYLNGICTTDRSTDPVQSGLFWQAEAGQPGTCSWMKDFSGTAYQALQAGPFLIDPGGTIGIRRVGGPAARRSAIALSTNKQCCLVVSPKPMTLQTCAQYLSQLFTVIPDFQTDAALNLDGGPATACWIRDQPNATIAPSGPIADVWMIPRFK